MGKKSKIARNTRNKKLTKVTKSHLSFLHIEIEIKTPIKSTFYYAAETWGKRPGFDPNTMKILENMLC